MTGWLAEALRALRPPQELTTAQWAEQYRILSTAESARPGPWRNEVTPYLVGIMDAFDDPEVEDITFVKCTQVGGTSVMLNMIGRAICCDPGPMMMVYPKDDLCEAASEEKLQPMIRSCPALREQYDENSKRLDLVFSSSRLALVSANSPSNLASRPVRYLFLDEEDKFPVRAGKEASPAKLAMERQHTFATSRKTVHASTPVFESGPIWQGWLDAGSQMEYFVPCPHCDAMWTFQLRQLKFPDGCTEEQALREACYVCEECGCVIHNSDKPGMLAKGEWRRTGGHGGKRRIAFRLNALYSPWVRFGEAAAEWINSQRAPEKLQNFVNSWLGEPFREVERTLDAQRLLDENESSFPAGVVPPGTVFLTGGVDVQRKSFFWTVRAWLSDFSSYNVAHGQAFSWPEIEEVMNAPYRGTDGKPMLVNLAAIDSGDQTDDVYAFCAVNRAWAVAVKGSSTRLLDRYKMSVIAKDGLGKGMPLILVDTAYYKDMIFSRILRGQESGGWLLYSGCDPEYAEMVTAEHKVIHRVRGHLVSQWEPKVTGGDNHYLDAEVYAACAADLLGMRSIYVRAQEAAREEPEPAQNPAADHSGQTAPARGTAGGSFRRKGR